MKYTVKKVTKYILVTPNGNDCASLYDTKEKALSVCKEVNEERGYNK